VSLEHLGNTNDNSKALVLAETLDDATDTFLENDKSPSRKVGELDNRGSHFYLALYWAQGIANQDKNAELKAEFTPIAKALSNNEERIISELNEIQGQAVNIGAYYQPNDAIASEAMRPSTTLNTILQSV
ncbi:MAG: NADP-dependent isocitrate dehydrogenase, partial [Polaribacter sp.]|nr:NADP-dependent isocitrate dehydrogenase [Polaribacter sp.]